MEFLGWFLRAFAPLVRCRVVTRSGCRDPSTYSRVLRGLTYRPSPVPTGTERGNICTVSGRISQNDGATVYTIAAAFLGAAGGGAWLGLILMSLVGLYGNILLWKNLMAGVLTVGAVAALSVLCGRSADRLAGLRVVLVAAFAALNVAAALYLFGDWVCEVPPAGTAFTNCRLPAPSGGLSFLDAALLLSPAGLAALLGASATARGLLRARRSRRSEASE